MKSLAKEAILQIEEKRYDIDLIGKVIWMGVAHNKKECEIMMKEK